MKRNFCFLIAVILLANQLFAQAKPHIHGINASKTVSVETIKKDAQFFKGDTLVGFNLDHVIQDGIRKYSMYSELLPYIRQQEIAFVKKKYKVATLSLEVDRHAYRSQVPSVLAGACGNVDFENGNYTGWTGGIGYNSNTHAALTITSPAISTLGANSPEPGCSFHTLVNGGIDPYSGLSMVDPGGGTWACRLGGEVLNLECDYYNSASPNYNPLAPAISNCTSNDPGVGVTSSFSNGETMQQTFAVTAANCLFSYNYSVVIADAPHTGAENPYFSVQVYDQAGALIPCLSYFVEADTTGAGGVPPGFAVSPSMDQLGNSVLYTPWTLNSLNLKPYIGQNVTIKFTAAGCTQGGHFCYAYVDCFCSPLVLIIPGVEVCIGGTQTMTAPPNAGGTYSWSGPGIVGSTTTGTITANQPGTYSVTITNAKGCAYVLDTIIDFYPKPVLSVTGATVCPGNTVTLNATSTGGAGTLTYNWSPPGGLSVTNDSTTVATGGVTTSYTVTGTSIHNCTNTVVCVVTVANTSPPTFSAPAVCLGATTVINNTTGGGGTFSWDFGDGSGVVPNQNSPTHTYTTTGVFNVTCTVNVGGCVGTNTANVTVNSNPTVTATNATFCSGAGPATLTAAGASTYTWNTGSIGANLNVNPATTTNYTVTGSTAAGCMGVATTSITVIPNPTVTATGSTICFGVNANLSANGATSYVWSGPNLLSNNASNVTANPSVTSNYTVVGTSNTCTASAVATVTVLPTPTVVVANQGPYCPGDAVPAPTFTDNPNDPATTFAWTNNNPALGLPGSGAGIPPAFTAQPNNTLTVETGVVTVTPTLNGCVGAPASYTITLKPTPFVNHVPGVEYCPGVNSVGVNFTAQPAGPTTFAWINTNNAIGLASSGTGNVPSFLTVNASQNIVNGVVHVVPTLNGCVGPDSSFVIAINPLPVPAFVFSKACIGDVTHFTDESSIGTGSIIKWGWDLNNDGIFLDATNANPQITLAPAGPHTIGLMVTSNKNCKSQVYETVYVNPLPVPVFVGNNLAGCPTLPVIFTESSSIPAPSNIISWSWDFGNGQTSVAQSPTVVMYHNGSAVNLAFYDVSLTVKTDSGCSATLIKHNYVTVYPQPHAGFNYTPSDVDILDPTVYFHNTSVGGSGNLPIKYYMGDVFIDRYDTANWSNLTNPIHVYNNQEDYTYYVTQWVKNIYGCKDSVTEPVIILPVYTFYIPNAFSPNGDGRNEGFKGTGIGIDNSTYNLWVFDRWGNQCFHSTNLEETWNGTVNEHLVQEDVYVWKVRFSDMGGTKHELHGHVSLIK
jgi:trimeric autotransporter adhesin